MAAATKDLLPLKRDGKAFGYPAKAGLRFWKGTCVAVTAAGLAVPAGTAGAVQIVGINPLHVDNRDGVDGAQTVEPERGTFGVTVTGATAANINAAVYALDDQTFQLTNAGGELRAGKLVGVGDGKHWVDFGA